jgi:hypothetical protein
MNPVGPPTGPDPTPGPVGRPPGFQGRSDSMGGWRDVLAELQRRFEAAALQGEAVECVLRENMRPGVKWPAIQPPPWDRIEPVCGKSRAAPGLPFSVLLYGPANRCRLFCDIATDAGLMLAKLSPSVLADILDAAPAGCDPCWVWMFAVLGIARAGRPGGPALAHDRVAWDGRGVRTAADLKRPPKPCGHVVSSITDVFLASQKAAWVLLQCGRKKSRGNVSGQGRKNRPRANAPLLLTPPQTDALTTVMECQGNIAKAARQLGKSYKTVQQHYRAALKKAGLSRLPKVGHKTQALPTGRDGEALVIDGPNQRW